MHRIDSPGAAPGGLFTEGDPAVGTPATVVSDDWLNAVQEELCGVVEGAGEALNKPSNGQVLAAIRRLIDLACPVGTVVMGYFTAAEPGFLLFDGVERNRADYPRLYAAMVARGFVVTQAVWAGGQRGFFSDGNGTTTFRTPLLGGQFPRIADGDAGVDPGRGVGTLQGDQNQAHNHLQGAGPYNTHGFVAGVGDAFSTGVPATPTGSSGGSEARPKNVAFGAMVRF